MNKLVLSLLVLLCLPLVLSLNVPAEYDNVDFVLVNSNDWKDIYQGLLFAKLIGKDADFILTPQIANDVVDSLPLDVSRLLLLETSGKEQLRGLDTLIERKDVRIDYVEGSSDLGLRLAEKFEPEGYIIIDEHYPYNAISVTPYALLKEYYVLFADEIRLDEITQILTEKNKPVIIYGLINSRVSQELSSFNPRIIDEGGKFDNNLEIVKEFNKEKPVKQVVVTNGEFIEIGLIDGEYPILFVGRTSTPDDVVSFLGESDIGFLVVVGNHLTDLTKSLKNTIENLYGKEMAVFVRFAKTPRILEEKFNQPHALEYFALPIIEPELFISKIAFNRLTNKIEVTYTNPSEITVFFLSSLTISSDERTQTVGDKEVQSVVAGQSKTLLYDYETTDTDISGNVIILYGDYPKSLEYELSADLGSIPVIELADESELEIVDIIYDKTNKAFFITVRNPSDVPVYANIELVDVIIDGLEETIGTQEAFLVEPHTDKEIYIRTRLSDLDLLENEEILVKGNYGQREQVLFKTVEQRLPLKVRLFNSTYLIVGAVALIVMLLLLLFIFGRRRELECDRCGHRERRRKGSRHSCGGVFRKK